MSRLMCLFFGHKHGNVMPGDWFFGSSGPKTLLCSRCGKISVMV